MFVRTSSSFFSAIVKANELRRISSLSSWFESVVLQRPNPFVQHLQEPGEIPTPLSISWSAIRPTHADKASASFLKDFQDNLRKLQSPTTPKSVLELQAEWSSLYGPVSYYEQILSVLAIGTEPPAIQAQWELAHASFAQRARETWRQAVAEKGSSGVTQWFEQETRDDALTTSQHKRWWKYWQMESGATLSNDRHTEWIKWQSALSGIRDGWMDVKPSQSRRWLPLLYSHIGSKQAMARDVWGDRHAAENAGILRYAKESLIVNLNEAVAEKVVPRVMLATDQKQDLRFKDLLKSKIFSLEAVLMVLQQLCADVFRVNLTWSDDSPQAWHPDVRTLQFSSIKDGADMERDDIKTVYLDLFARSGKPQFSAAIPLSPLATVVSINLESPVWDTDTVFMTFLELVDLFHEMGHVLQQLSATGSSPIGANPSWPADWAELLPKFMEQWVWEPTILKSLVVASGEPVDDETIEALYEQASIAKADDLARQVFFSATEWAMFSSFNIQEGGETVMALAQRMARQYIPHDLPHSADLGALYSIADANIRDNEHVALYRYIWAEAVATNIFEKVKSSYETKKGLPSSAIREHLVNPSSFYDLSIAFELSAFLIKDPALDALWRRYRLS